MIKLKLHILIPLNFYATNAFPQRNNGQDQTRMAESDGTALKEKGTNPEEDQNQLSL